MVNRYIVLWDTVTKKAVYSEMVKPLDLIGALLGMIKEVYETGLYHRVEIIHVGTEKEGGTITRDEIKRLGRLMTKEAEPPQSEEKVN